MLAEETSAGGGAPARADPRRAVAHRDASPWLPLLQRAVIQERVLRVRYHSFSSDELTEREIEPYCLVFYGNDWHLVGYCRLRDGIRDFRCGRVRDAS